MSVLPATPNETPERNYEACSNQSFGRGDFCRRRPLAGESRTPRTSATFFVRMAGSGGAQTAENERPTSRRGSTGNTAGRNTAGRNPAGRNSQRAEASIRLSADDLPRVLTAAGERTHRQPGSEFPVFGVSGRRGMQRSPSWGSLNSLRAADPSKLNGGG
jgi:hypothetical protein